MRDILKMIIVLSVICGLSGVTLATVRDATMERIQLQELNFVKKPSIVKAVSGYDNDPIVDRREFTTQDGATVLVFPAKRDGRLFAVAIEDVGPGYGGDVSVVVGFDIATDTMTGVGIAPLKETPGVGSRTGDKAFGQQFKGHSLDVDLKSGGGDIDAIAGATVSSTASVTAVKKAVRNYRELKDKIKEAWS